MAEVNETAEKERSGDDVMNLLKTIYDNMNKGFDELRGVINKGFDRMDKQLDKGFDMMKKHLNEIDKKWGGDRYLSLIHI